MTDQPPVRATIQKIIVDDVIGNLNRVRLVDVDRALKVMAIEAQSPHWCAETGSYDDLLIVNRSECDYTFLSIVHETPEPEEVFAYRVAAYEANLEKQRRKDEAEYKRLKKKLGI